MCPSRRAQLPLIFCSSVDMTQQLHCPYMQVGWLLRSVTEALSDKGVPRLSSTQSQRMSRGAARSALHLLRVLNSFQRCGLMRARLPTLPASVIEIVVYLCLRSAPAQA